MPRNPETLIGGFMKLIGQQEIWENIKKGNAIARAWQWFQTALAGLMSFVQAIPGKIIDTIASLTIEDIVTVAGAFTKVVGVFGNMAGDFISWGLNTTWNLLEIVFDVVKPGLMGYIKKTGAALKNILKNPMPFLGNLVKAAKLGFTNFADNIGNHLKAGLIDWLTASLTGVYIPKALNLMELGKFALSILGITWAQIRGKIVKVLGPNGETIMKGLETGFDIVVALFTGGMAAAWELIKEKLTNLKDMVIGGIVDFVTDTIVKKAIPKIIGMFIPGAGFIPAIISIYDTVMVFVQKISKIIQVVTAFIDSIVAIAGGAIGAATKRVEGVLAGLLSLAISFLAGFLGLGKVTDKIMGVIEKVRPSVDKAIDGAIAWIVGKAKALFANLFGKKDGKPDEQDPEKQKKIEAGIKQLREEEGRLAKDGKLSLVAAKQLSSLVKSKHSIFRSFEAFESGTHIKYRYTASPPIVIEGPEELAKYDVNESDIEAPETDPGANEWGMSIFANITDSTGKHRQIWVDIAIPMDPELKIPKHPPAPSMVIEGRVIIDGERKQLRLNGGSITEYALKLIRDRYQAKFGNLDEIHGSLGDDNKSLYQIAYATLRSRDVDEDTAKFQALQATPFGKYRTRLKYDKFEITLSNFEWARIPKLEPDPKKRFLVPTKIHVIARR